MNERQKALLEKLGLSESDFSPKESVISDEERISDIELALCELLDMVSATAED